MTCPERAKLEKDHDEAQAAVEAAGNLLRSRIGVSQRDEYDRLSRAADDAWNRLNHARGRLDHHIRKHGCQAQCSAALGT